MANVHPKYISDIERGKKSPSLYIISKIARALNTSPVAFISENIYESKHGYAVMDSSPDKYNIHTDEDKS